MKKDRVLFICVHNSARSQIAEAFLNQLGGDLFEAESAGLEPGELNPLAVATMQEIGIDISDNSCTSVHDRHRDLLDRFKAGEMFSYVISVCDGASAEKCPIFPGIVTRLHWDIKDPAAVEGTWEEKLAAVREIREEIRRDVEAFIKNNITLPC